MYDSIPRRVWSVYEEVWEVSLYDSAKKVMVK